MAGEKADDIEAMITERRIQSFADWHNGLEREMTGGDDEPPTSDELREVDQIAAAKETDRRVSEFQRRLQEEWGKAKVRDSFELPEPTKPAGDPRFLALLDEMATLHRAKSSDYGAGQDPLANLRASARFGISPWKATLIRMGDKMTRLESFAVKGELANESFEDTLRDLACYSLLALILYGEESGK